MSIFLQALKKQNKDRPPVWIMRQAGRYLPEYRAIREKHSFLEMVQTPRLAANITKLPIDIIGTDAAILFSDILVVAEAMGLNLRFQEGRGPYFERSIKDEADIDALPLPEAKQALSYVGKAIRILKQELHVPLIGFCGGPLTVASYMLEGHFPQAKQWMLAKPAAFHKLLERITILSSAYLQMQEEEGVDALQVFDSWAGLLPPRQFQEFSLQYLERLIKPLKTPTILFCKGSSHYYRELAALKPTAVGLDWTCKVADVRKEVSITLQGNLDPDILLGPKERVIEETCALLHSMKKDQGFIFNLGHGILPRTPVENVQAMIECIKKSTTTSLFSAQE